MDVRARVKEHFDEAVKMFSEKQIVGIFLQGSQNYGLETPESDVDTKCIIVPTFYDMAMNHKLQSGTYVLENEEHLDYKDIRLYFQTLRKQNLNFLEILFTDYFIINPMFAEEWGSLLDHREEIVRMNPCYAIKAMNGVAHEKYRKLFIRTEINAARFDQYNYDPKQLFHLFRIKDFIDNYINGHPFKKCMKPSNPEFYINIKHGYYTDFEAEEVADKTLKTIDWMSDCFLNKTPVGENREIKEFLDKILYQIVEKSVKGELL